MSTMLSPVCLRAENEGSKATQVLCPEANRMIHRVLVVHRAVRPHEGHMSLCIPSRITSLHSDEHIHIDIEK